jgi:hypothetical protein
MVAIEIAEHYGVEVPFIRPPYLATDTATSLDVVLHAVKYLKPYTPDIVVILEPTSPLRTADDINGLLRQHIRTDAEAVYNIEMGTFSVRKDVLGTGSLYGKHPIVYNWSGIDINTEDDWKRAEKEYYKKRDTLC